MIEKAIHGERKNGSRKFFCSVLGNAVSFVMVVVLVGFVDQASALSFDRTLHVDGAVNERLFAFDTFQFLEGGRALLDFRLQRKDVDSYFLLCSLEEVNKVNQMYQTVDTLCDNRHFIGCSVQKYFYGNESITMDYTIMNKNVYFLILENCLKETFELQMTYTLINPGNEHLGYNLIPMPSAYNSLILLSSMLYFLWLYNWFQHRHEPHIYLHSLISFIPIVKISDLILTQLFWIDLSTQGVPSKALSAAKIIVGTGVYDFITVFSILLVTYGWCITTPQLSNQSMIFCFVNSMILSLVITLNNFYQSYYALMLIMVYFVTYRVIFLNLSHQINILHGQLFLMESNALRDIEHRIVMKLRLFDILRRAFVGYVFALVMVQISGIFLYLEYTWVSYTLRELLDIATLSWCLFFLRLQKFNYPTNENEETRAHNMFHNSQVVFNQNHVELQVFSPNDPFTNIDVDRDVVVIQVPSTTARHSDQGLSNLMIGRREGERGSPEPEPDRATLDDSDEEIGLLGHRRVRRT